MPMGQIVGCNPATPAAMEEQIEEMHDAPPEPAVTPLDTDEHAPFMRRAIELSRSSVAGGTGPFGAVIVKDGVIIGEGHNMVTGDPPDATAHAEVSAIRAACKNTGQFFLEGAVCYTSCEPCPMCLAACYWAHLDKIYYGNTQDDAAAIGFDDRFLYEEFKLPMARRTKPCIPLLRDEALAGFKDWENKNDKTKY